MTGEDLTAKLAAALRTHGARIELDRNLVDGCALIRITVPGPTRRANRVQPVPVIIGKPGETWGDMIHTLVGVLNQHPDIKGG